MSIDLNRIVCASKKYVMLICAIVFSVCTGYVAYCSSSSLNCIENDVIISEGQKIVSGFNVEDIIANNKTIIEKIEVEEEELPFSTITIGTSRSGNKSVLEEGVNGIAKATYKVKIENEEEVEKIQLSKAVALKPTTQVVAYSSNDATISRGNIDRNENETVIASPVSGYSKVIKMRYTAYCLCEKCCGKKPTNPNYGLTALGYRITPGNNDKVVAIDPSVIKLGSYVYVQGINGKADYGYAYACDTGGAIKGNRIDLYYDSHQEALKVGTGYAYVYVFDK